MPLKRESAFGIASAPAPVTLFEGFAPDRSKSMEVYAEGLGDALARDSSAELRVHKYRPVLSPGAGRVGLRVAKYLTYPYTARRHQGSINHIVDHAYGHLVNGLDRKRTVVTVHDIIPILAWKGLVPGLTYPHKPLLFNYAIRSIKRAAAIIADSETTKRDLVTECGFDEQRINVIHPGIDRRFKPISPGSRAENRRALGFSEGHTPVVLIVATNAYKNNGAAIAAVAMLEEMLAAPVQLAWLAGNDAAADRCPAARRLRLPIVYLNNLPTDQLAVLYNSVDVLLFPSLYEGFGWPPLEAMACGTPVVTSHAPTLVEVTGDASRRAAAEDPLEIAQALRDVLENPSLRSDLVARGHRNVRRFTWEGCASEVAAIYDSLLAGGRQR